MHRVAVTGLGGITAIGNSPTAMFDAALGAVSGVKRAPELATGAVVPLVASANFDVDSVVPRVRTIPMDRSTALALAAARQAVADSGLDISTAPHQTGVYWGTGMGSVATLENAYDQVFNRNNWKLRPTTVITMMYSAPAAQISLEFGITGPTPTYTVACASSAIAIGEAMRAIQHGYIDRAIVGGSDAMLTRGTFAAWGALRTLAKEDPVDAARSCKPFDEDRSGFVLGEGAGALVLENAEHARRRGAAIYAELAGYGLTSDARHISDPSSDGQVRAIDVALRSAGVDRGDIGYINAHGTATSVGDRTETAAIKEIFGDRATHIPVSSTKAIHGHVMGATGVVEFMIALLALRHGVIPPTAHLAHPDPQLGLDFVPGAARHGVRLGAIMSNTIAFGGTNAVLVARDAAQRL